MTALLSYYIVDRKSGISYDPEFCIDNMLFAHSNRANRRGMNPINIPLLIKGIGERRYRLVAKNIAA